jgi:DNA-binding NtrC family response regulator
MEGLKEIEEDGYLPVLVITAQSDLATASKPAKDFVGKPFDHRATSARYNILEVRLLHQKRRTAKCGGETVRARVAAVIRLKSLGAKKSERELA